MKSLRLFLALWPDKQAAVTTFAAARRLLENSRGRVVPAERLHLTLAFLGAVASEALPRVSAAARGVSAPAFELGLDEVGFYKRAGVAWFGPSAPPAALMELATQLHETLHGAGFLTPPRGFRPHVSIARKLNKRPHGALDAPIIWRCRAFFLVHSVTHASGPHYEQIERFPLGSGLA